MGRLLFCCRDLKRLKKSFIGCKGNIVYNERREKQAAASADICFSQVINEGSACVSRQWSASAREPEY